MSSPTYSIELYNFRHLTADPIDPRSIGKKIYNWVNKVLWVACFTVFVSTVASCAQSGNSPKTPQFRQQVPSDRNQLIGQSLIIALRWDEGGRPIHKLGLKEIALLKEIQPGGVALFAANLDTVEQTRALIRQIQEACLIPPFIAIDEEGGRVSRLTTGRAIGATRIPSARRLAASGAIAVETAYTIIGTELHALGINMDFAPVADLDLDLNSGVIGDRSFGSEPIAVAQMVALAVRSLQNQKVLAVLKHYPGHGRATGDSHLGTQKVVIGWRTLLRNDLLPFMAAVHAEVAGMMSAHVAFPEIDPSNLPVSMSSFFLRDKLRNSLNFKGLIISDALDMAGILDLAGPEQAAEKSYIAGVDMLLCPEDALQICLSMRKSVTSGKIPLDRLMDSYNRILDTKKRFGLLSSKVDLLENPQMRAIIGSESNKKKLSDALRAPGIEH